MNVIFILIAVSLLVATGFLVAFIWTIRTGQFEDEYTPSVRILFEDETNVIEEKEKGKGKREKGILRPPLADSGQAPKPGTRNPEHETRNP